MSLEEAAQTTSKVISYKMQGKEETVSVRIPPGVSTGKKLRLKGKGYPAYAGGPKGDLYIKIKVLDDALFKREGDDLYVHREIKFSEAVLGTEISVPTIDKKTLRLKIPPGTQNHAKFRLKGYGMPHMDGSGRGDAYIRVSIVVPTTVNKKQEELVKRLSEMGF
jgi:curved DNA-binding protein